MDRKETSYHERQKVLWIIPEDWDSRRLAEVVDKPIVYGIVQAGPEIPNGVPYIRSTDVGDEIDISNLSRTSREIALKYKRSEVGPGDIVFSLRGNIGELSIVPFSLPEANLTQGTARISINESICDRRFVAYVLKSFVVTKTITKASKGSTFKEISLEQLRRVELPLPKLSEQVKIARLINTWDLAITHTTQLIAQKELRKKWLMQQLLTGKKRLKGFKGKWVFIKFGEIYNQIKEKAGDKKYFPLSVTKNGIVSQAEYFNKEIQSEDTSPYLVVRRGNMVMSGLNFWMGAIDVLSEFKTGVVSPAYKVFEIRHSEISPEFMKAFVRSELMLKALIGASVQGASIVRRNLDKETLEEWSFHLPSFEEQKAIAKVLQSADAELNLLRQKLDKLKEQKRGLMQILLTGKKRLKIAGIKPTETSAKVGRD